MKTKQILPLVMMIGASAVALGVSGRFAPRATIDIDALPNYANQPVPDYITKNNTPPNNQISDIRATLGRVLFYDVKLSVNNTVSCATCHQQASGFSDTADASVGVNGSTGRHSMRLINARFARERQAFWDERAATFEEQATMPIQDHAEMGFSGQDGDPDFNDLIVKLEAVDYYPPLFQLAFGDEEITEDRIQRSIAQFVRSIQSFDSKFDAGRAQAPNDGAPFNNFTASENRGKQLFLAPPQFNPQGLRVGGGVGCAGCHQPPEFDIDPNSLSNGVIGTLAGTGNDVTVTRSPSLRDLLNPDGEPNGPFMHDASMPLLEDVIAHYNTIPDEVTAPQVRPFIDNRLIPGGNPQRLQMTAQEIDDLVAFLHTLTGENVYTDERWSSPFDAEGNLMIEGLFAPSAGGGWLIY